MKKIYFGLLISLTIFSIPTLSLAQVKDSIPGSGDTQIRIVPVNGVCPDNYVLSQNKEECFKPDILPKIPIAPNDGFKDIVGVSFFLAPINGKCQENHIISDDGKACIKLDIKIPIAPLEGYKDIVGVSFSPPTPVNGKCPDGYVVSQDSKECLKVLPKIIIAPHEGFKEVIFESGGKTTIKDNNVKKEGTITSKDGFGVTVFVKFEGGKQAKEIVVESKASSDVINISAGKISASTKEAVEVKENKIFLNKKEIKIMPDTASEKAVEKLGDLGFKIELKDMGDREANGSAYEAVGIKDVKILWLFKTKMKVSANIDAQTGEVSEANYPWWSFLAR